MDEAYLIGIRIALEDEVSGELGAFGRQIEAYERTIDAAAGSWEVGQGTQKEAGAPQNRQEPEGRNRPETSQVDDPMGFLTSERPVAAPAIEAQAPSSSPADPVGELTAYLDNSPEGETASPEMSCYLQEGPSDYLQGGNSDYLQEGNSGYLQEGNSESDEREKLPSSASEESERYLPGGDVDIAGLGVCAEPDSPLIRGLGWDFPQVPSPTAIGNSENQQAKASDTGQVFGSQPTTSRPAGQPDLPAGQESAAPAVQSPAAGPTEGDVYLDGNRLGRWMADRLEREVDRAQGGFTGFDPRLGIAWPGALHGT